MVLWDNATWKLLPENFRFQGRDTRTGISSGEAGKEVWFIPGHVFSAFGHILLIWVFRAPDSEVSGIPSQIYALEGPGEDIGSQIPAPPPLLSCLGRESVSPLPKQNMQFSLEPFKWPLSFSELTFCDFYRTAVCEMSCCLDTSCSGAKIPEFEPLAPHLRAVRT